MVLSCSFLKSHIPWALAVVAVPKDELPPFDFNPARIGPVDPEQFFTAIQVAAAAGSLRMPMESPSKRKVALEMKDGTYEQFRFTDTLINRAMMAMRDYFGENHEDFMNTAMRVFALQGIGQSKRMEKWLKKSEDNPEMMGIHDAVLQAAATVPLNVIGEFDETTFFDEVERLAQEDEES